MPIGSRFKTGERCLESGVFQFDGYLDGTASPAPTQEERVIPLSRSETFPPLRSSNKACYWKMLRST